jgi:Spy/CpxP family protein refolding chaperone
MRTNSWKLAVASVLLGLCSFAAYAQSGESDGPPSGPPPGGANHMPPSPDRELKMLTKLLTLTTEQQTGVKALLEEQATEMKALRAKGQSESSQSSDSSTNESPQARMAQMEQIHDETNTKIAALLDDSQKKVFAEWLEKRKAEMEQLRSQGGEPPAPPDGGGPPPNL